MVFIKYLIEIQLKINNLAKSEAVSLTGEKNFVLTLTFLFRAKPTISRSSVLKESKKLL